MAFFDFMSHLIILWFSAIHSGHVQHFGGMVDGAGFSECRSAGEGDEEIVETPRYDHRVIHTHLERERASLIRFHTTYI